MNHRPGNAPVFALLMGIFFVVWLFFYLVLDFNGLYGQDSHEYYRFARDIARVLPGFPVNDPFFWPAGYPLAGALMIRIFGESPLPMQLLSLFSAAVSGFLLWRLASEYSDRRLAKQFLIIAFALSPAILMGSVVVMSDLLAMALLLLACFLFSRWIRKPELSGVLLLCMVSWGAFEIRNPVALLLFPFFGFIGWRIFRDGLWFQLLAVSLVAAVFLCAKVLPEHPASPYLSNHLREEWSMANFFRNRFEGVEGIHVYKLPNILSALSWMLHPVYFLPGLLILPAMRRSDVTGPLVACSIAALVLMTLVVAGLPLQNKRYMLTAFPLYLLVLAPAAVRVMAKWSSRPVFYPIMIITIILQLGWAWYNARTYLNINSLEQKLVSGVRTTVPSGSILYTFSVEGAFGSYGYPGEVRSLFRTWNKDELKNTYLLAPPSEMAADWENTAVGAQLEVLQQSGKMEFIKEIEPGWNLYVIR